MHWYVHAITVAGRQLRTYHHSHLRVLSVHGVNRRLALR
jgi:hypothetical protein